MTAALAALTKEEKEDECISHVIKLRSSWSEGNYVRFFKLYSTAPKMSGEDDKIHWSFNPNSGLGVNVPDVKRSLDVTISCLFLIHSELLEDQNKFNYSGWSTPEPFRMPSLLGLIFLTNLMPEILQQIHFLNI